MIRNGLALLGLALCSSGCAGVPDVRSRIPFMYHEQKSSDDAFPYQRDAHRQYFDKLHHRYYYYDPVQKSYFWEDGQPKG